ncbi:MAG: HAMP domain-containing protein, partial [Candidatus Hydrogenedentota bacterium]
SINDSISKKIEQTFRLYRLELEARLKAFRKKDKITNENPEKWQKKLLKKLLAFQGSKSYIVSSFRVQDTARRILFTYPHARKRKQSIVDKEYALLLKSYREKKSYAIPNPKKEFFIFSVPSGVLAIPLYSESKIGYVFLADIPFEDANIALSDFRRSLVVALAILFFASIMMGWKLYGLLAKPLVEAGKEMKLLQNGQYGQKMKFENRNDEMGILAFAINSISETLKEEQEALQKEIEELRKQNDILEKELKMGQAIQQGMLPHKEEIVGKGNRLKVASTYEPLEFVSGDYFDFFVREDGAIFMLIADASGHGIPAALVTILAKMTFSQYVEEIPDLGQLLMQANQHLAQAVVTSEYMTAFALLLHPDGTLEYCNGSHQKAYLCREKELMALDTSGFFLGAIEELPLPYTPETISIQHKDRIVLYTDGIIEAMNPRKEEFGQQRFEKLLNEGRELSAEDLKNKIMKEVEVFSEGAERFDDYTLVVIDVLREDS